MNSVLLVGAGARGHHVYGRLLADHLPEVRMAGVVEPDATRRAAFRSAFGLPGASAYATLDELPDRPVADLAIVATPDVTHVEIAVRLLEQGYDLLLEKPVATRAEDLNALADVAARCRASVYVAHVLRYAPFCQAVNAIVRGGTFGRIRHIELSENVGHWHFAHSYVRGNWRREADSAPILLAKSCHDLDLLVWWLNEPVRTVASIARLGYFRPGNAPEGASARCTECRHADGCRYSATRFYVHDEVGWPWDVLGGDRDARAHAIRTTAYGRCVFDSDNDVPDAQLVQIRTESGVFASFSLLGLSAENTRKLRILLDDAEVVGDLAANVLEIVPLTGRPGEAVRERVPLAVQAGHHGGGDLAMLRTIRDHRRTGAHADTITSLPVSLASHHLAFTAERSRAAQGIPIRM